MRYEVRVLLILFLSLISIALLIVLSIVIKVPECPEILPDEYYVCSDDFDCMYSSVFECMNRNKDFQCNPDPSVVKLHQEISSKLSCVCESNKCKTVFNRAV